MTEDQILTAKPYLDATLDGRAVDLVDAFMHELRTIAALRSPIDDLPDSAKMDLHQRLSRIAAAALEGKPLVPQEAPAIPAVSTGFGNGEPLEPDLDGMVFDVQPGGGLLLSQQIRKG